MSRRIVMNRRKKRLSSKTSMNRMILKRNWSSSMKTKLFKILIIS